MGKERTYKFTKTASKKILEAFNKARREGRQVVDDKTWVRDLQHKLKNRQPVVPKHFKYNYPRNFK